MALKGDRNEAGTDISFFMNEVQTRGIMVWISTAGSGAALDQSAALVTATTNPSGKQVVGMLLNDMVNLDLTRQHANYYKDETQKGGKVTLLTRGWAVTNSITGTPTAGQSAYCTYSGVLTASPINIAQTPLVGRFLSTKDEDGYAKVEINLPMGSVFNPI